MHFELFGGWERWGGCILGIAHSIIYISLFLFGLTLLPFTYVRESVQEKSFSASYIKEVAPKISEFIIQFKPKSGENK
jgi:hypothetical protein